MPPPEYWFTIDAAYFVGAFLVSLVLGLLGIGRVRPITIVMLLVISFGIMVLGLSSMANQAKEAAELKEKITKLGAFITGGDNFAFFTVEPKIASNGENYLTVTTTGPMPLFDCSMRFLSPNGEVVGGREWSIRPLPKVTARFAHLTLPPGRYRADCIMGEKSWQQHLEFSRTTNGIDQVFWVEKNNRVVKEGP